MIKKKNFTDEIHPVIFQNKPIETDDKDLFDYAYQKMILNSVIDKGSRIIGIIGDYGTGKSSITKMLEKDRREKGDKIVNINLWGLFRKKESSDELEQTPLIRSFLYQLAYANNPKNANFAKYINARFNKNNGKLSFAIATRKMIILLLLAALFLCLFFTFKTIDIKVLSIANLTEFTTASSWQKALSIMSYSRYFALTLGIGFILCAAGIAAPVFSSWKSEGKYDPESSDTYELYLRIIKRLIHLPIPHLVHWIIRKIRNKKIIVFIDDLDRTSNKETVVSFLKEIYKYIHLVPYSIQKKLVFIISLKAESLLNIQEKDKDNPDTKNIYSKIFDYTLNIKQIHNENYRDIVKNLLYQEKETIVTLNRTFQTDLSTDEEIINQVLFQLKWLYNDENLTIREIKERLNETFLLYQTLLNRNYESPSIELRKCAGVTFLKRKNESDYNELLKHENEFAQLIRACNKDNSDNAIKNAFNEFETNTKSPSLLQYLKDMIKERVIEDDFSMYFYNYPKNSYIKNYNEKALFDALIRDDTLFLSQVDSTGIIQEAIELKNGKAIDEAYEKYLQEKIPDIVFLNEALFCYTFINYKNKREHIKVRLINEIMLFLSNRAFNSDIVNNILSFNYDSQFKNELRLNVENLIKARFQKLAPDEIEEIRTRIIYHFSESLFSFARIFTNEDLPLLSIDTLEKIKDENVKSLFLYDISESRLHALDEMIMPISDSIVEPILIDRHCIISVLFHYYNENKIDEFDITPDWIPVEFLNQAKKILEINVDFFISIRKSIKSKNKALPEIFYVLYNGSFPLITEEELLELPVSDLYQYIDQKRINGENYKLVSNYCNQKELSGNDLYDFMYALFLDDDYCISDVQVVKQIFETIDFDKIKFVSLAEEKVETLLSKLNSVFDFDTVDGAFEFMKISKCIIRKFEKTYFNEILTNDDLFEEYLQLINYTQQVSGNALTMISKKCVHVPLIPKITKALLKMNDFSNYIVGKTLYDQKLVLNTKIPLEVYFGVFISSDECFDYFTANNQIIIQFYEHKLYLSRNVPIERLKIWYSWRQPIELIKTIMETLERDEAEQKEYLHQITDIDTEEDASSFIDFIIQDAYIGLLRDETLFYYLWHKMWKSYQKGRLTKLVNKKLGTDYHAKDFD